MGIAGKSVSTEDTYVTSRERVNACLDNSLEGRIPRQLWTLPWSKTHYPEMVLRIEKEYPDDIMGCLSLYKSPPMLQGDHYSLGEFTDEWGCTFVNIQEGIIGEVKESVIADWSDVKDLRVPKELLTVDRDAVNDFCRTTDRFILQGSCARPFERLQFLRRSEALYVDLAEDSEGLHRLIQKVHGFFLDEMKAWATTDVDALFYMDDWGSQQSLLISPSMWRKIFKPLYKDYVDLAHNAGKRIFMHSDGCIRDIIPDLVELGVDALNSQIFCIGVENLKPYRDRICFWGEVDRQHLLPYASTEEIRLAVGEVYANLYHNGGGVGQCEFGPGANPENVYTVFKTWDELTG